MPSVQMMFVIQSDLYCRFSHIIYKDLVTCSWFNVMK